MSGYNDKQKALMYDALAKLVQFRNEVEEYIEIPDKVCVTPQISQAFNTDDEIMYFFSLDVDSRYAYMLFWVYEPDEEGKTIKVCKYDGLVFDPEKGVSVTLKELEDRLKEELNDCISFANSLGKEYSNE